MLLVSECSTIWGVGLDVESEGINPVRLLAPRLSESFVCVLKGTGDPAVLRLLRAG